MAKFSYFADMENGEVIELNRIYYKGGNKNRASSYAGYPVNSIPTINTPRTTATRMIEMKSAPSRHECDARCLNATGRIMKCECSCGGKNHGRGAFTCVAV